MKKIFLYSILAIAMIACNNTPKQAEQITDTPKFELDNLLAIADDYVGKEVKVSGFVTHTCKHAGQRCFITSESQNSTLRVEAKGKIGGFDRELTGSKIEVVGQLNERRLTTSEIDAMEEKIEAKRISDSDSAESCDAEMANVQKMRNLMAEQNKDYYSIYYIDGEDYAEVK